MAAGSNSGKNMAQNVREIADQIGNGKFSIVGQVLSALAGAGVGGVISYTSLLFLGSNGLSAAGISSGLAKAGKLVGGGMVQGVFLLAVPIMLLSGVGVGLVSRAQNKKLEKQREELVEAVILQGTHAHNMRNESAADKQRADDLQMQNELLKLQIEQLKAEREEGNAGGSDSFGSYS